MKHSEKRGIINGWPGGMKVEPKTLSLIPEFHKLIATSIDYNTLGNRKVRISLKDLSNRLNKLNEQSDLKKIGCVPTGGGEK